MLGPLGARKRISPGKSPGPLVGARKVATIHPSPNTAKESEREGSGPRGSHLRILGTWPAGPGFLASPTRTPAYPPPPGVGLPSGPRAGGGARGAQSPRSDPEPPIPIPAGPSLALALLARVPQSGPLASLPAGGRGARGLGEGGAGFSASSRAAGARHLRSSSPVFKKVEPPLNAAASSRASGPWGVPSRGVPHPSPGHGGPSHPSLR